MTRKWNALLTILVSSLDALIHGCCRLSIMDTDTNMEICHSKGMSKNQYRTFIAQTSEKALRFKRVSFVTLKL